MFWKTMCRIYDNVFKPNIAEMQKIFDSQLYWQYSRKSGNLEDDQFIQDSYLTIAFVDLRWG